MQNLIHDKQPEWPISQITNWVQQNIRKISLAFDLTGGWEVWAQVELGVLMRGHNPAADREQPMFQRAPEAHQRAPRFDIWIPKNPNINDCKWDIGIELKVRLKNEDTLAPFQSRLEDDFHKVVLNEGPKNASQQLQASTYVVGITHLLADVQMIAEELSYSNPQSKYWGKRNKSFPLGNVYYKEVSGVAADNTELKMYIMWWRQTWPNNK